jgi:hypothetical protein
VTTALAILGRAGFGGVNSCSGGGSQGKNDREFHRGFKCMSYVEPNKLKNFYDEKN